MVAEVKTLDSNNPEIQRLDQIFQAQQAAFRQNRYPSLAQRREHLDRLKPLLLDHMEAWAEAISADFGNRAHDETKLAEIVSCVEGLKYYHKNVAAWMKPEKRKVGLLQWPGKARVEFQPLGVVGIIVPWNYPLYLAIGPLVAALAAGNRVMIKMSEATPRTGELLAKLIGETFDEDHVAVVNGEVEVAQAFSSLPFDHLFFTGSTTVGRHVMRAAAANLTPVTLELGGKSPAIIGNDFPMREAVDRIGFGKCINSGQTCVAPDYVLCPRHRVDEFVDTWTSVISQMYPTMRDNDDFTGIVNDRQLSRLQRNLDDAREKGARIVEINPANEDFTGSGKIPHTLVLDVTDDMVIAGEEIFGPVMLVIPYDNLDQAIAHVNDGPRPLALYYFDWDQNNCDHVLKHTHSGGVSLNDAATQVITDDLPFGGVGASGMGSYHGPEGFRTFSHGRAVYQKGKINAAKYVMPPHGNTMQKLVYKLMLK